MITVKLVWVHNGPKGAVALTETVASDFERVDAKVRARISRQMRWFTELELSELNREAFRFEERFTLASQSKGAAPREAGSKKGKPRNIAIHAFKGWKVRIYGGIANVKGKRTFIGTEIDVSKKQDKGDRSLMKSAAVKFGEILE